MSVEPTALSTLQQAGAGVPGMADAASHDVAVATLQIERRLPRLRFPAVLEQQFADDGLPRRLSYFVFTGLLSLVVFNGFLLVDYLMARDVFWLAVKVRLGVFTPVALTVLAVAWLARDWVLRNLSPAIIECIVMVSGVCASGSLAYILAASRSPFSQYYHVGLMVVIMYGNVVQRLRFGYAAAFSLAVYLMHIGGVLMVPGFNPRLTMPMVALVGATVAFTLMANYALERDERRRYLLSLRRKALIGELGSVNERLLRLSRVDALTGLYNRRHMDEYVQQVWQRALHDGDDLAIIMLDVDHFKRYNDRYGHPQGDQCLMRVAEALTASLRRPGDLVARFGGEEFIAILPQADMTVALKAAERVRAAVQAQAMRHEASTTAPVVTVSLGVSSVKVEAGRSVAGLIAAADEALYHAKSQGRNQVVTHPE
jgi:diguanylate cyclase (GGDEF)-like protein